jgi:glycosyltransferase involved in cell wall biosynthesis
VTVIIPAINEEANIGEVIKDVMQTGYRNVIVVDGHSTDRTVEVAKDLGAQVLLQNGRGKGDALIQAFDNGLRGHSVVIMDADGSMNAKEIPGLVEALESGADVAKGSRFLPYGYSEDLSLVRRIGNLFFVTLVNLLWSANYTDLCYGFGAFRRDALKKLYPLLRSRHFEIETEIGIKALKLGFKIAEVPSTEFRRRHGKSNLKAISDGFVILQTIIREYMDQYRGRKGRKQN